MGGEKLNKDVVSVETSLSQIPWASMEHEILEQEAASILLRTDHKLGRKLS